MIDHSVYPDARHANDFSDDFDRADYLDRVCAAWDFGVPPERETVTLFSGWRDVFDRFPLAASPSYHAFRAYFRWPEFPAERCLAPAQWELLDAFEGREDPFQECV